MKKNISISILILFLIPISMSIISEVIPSFVFGDWKCKGKELIEKVAHNSDGSESYYNLYVGCNYPEEHEPTLHWGFRHWLFITLGIVLFVVRMIQIIYKFT